MMTTGTRERSGRIAAARCPMAALSKPKSKKSGVLWEPRPLAGSNFCADELMIRKILRCSVSLQCGQGLSDVPATRTHRLKRDYSRFQPRRGGLAKVQDSQVLTPLSVSLTQKIRGARKFRAEIGKMTEKPRNSLRILEFRIFGPVNHESPCGTVGSDEMKTAICNERIRP
jgi:hypothetical protein